MAKAIGYTEIRVGGKIIPLRFCLWALRSACKNLGITLEEFFEKIDGAESGSASIFEITDFYAEVLKEAANHELEAGVVPYTNKYAYNWIDEMGMTSEAFKSVVRVLMESITWQITGKSLDEIQKQQAEVAAAQAETQAKKKPTAGKK
jgi:hypothetical protein